MAKILDFNKPPDQDTVKLFMLASSIDSIIQKAVSDNISTVDIAAVLANRLGELCGAIKKANQHDVVEQCIDLTRKQYLSHFDSTEG